MTVAVESKQFNPMLTIYDPSDYAIASNNPNEKRIRFKLSKTGTYRIGVQGNNPSQAGQYSLVIRR